MRLALGFAVACAALYAQSAATPEFRNLATTDDGSRLYFSSSAALAGAAASQFSRIFVFGPQGLHVFAQQDNQALSRPSASGGAEVVAYTGDSQSSLALGSGAVFWTGAGRAYISRNARYALFASDGAATVLNLGSLAKFTAAFDPVQGTGAGIASDGTAAIPGSTSIQILRASGMTSFPAQGIPAAAAIDDQAATVAYEANGRIILLDLASGTESIGADPGVAPRLSSDGTVLLYLAPDANGVQQAWAGTRQLTAEDAGISEAVLSGDGATAYAVVNLTRILRIDVASGRSTDITAAITKAVPQQPRVISLTAGSGQLCYQVENATSITIQPQFGVVPPPGACLTAKPSITTTYTLTASNDSGTTTASATLEVASVAITGFTNDPAYSPSAGGPVTLQWTTQNAVSVGLTGLGVPAGTLLVNGSVVVHPVTNTTYTLIAYGANGQAVSAVLYIFVR
jgi:hypothetical protein